MQIRRRPRKERLTIKELYESQALSCQEIVSGPKSYRDFVQIESDCCS